jgi:acetamidase/formamidase
MNSKFATASACVVAAAALVRIPVEAQAGRTHKLTVTPATAVWGHFTATKPPILTVASGDTVEISTVLEAAETMRVLGVDDKWVTDEMRAIDQVTDRGPGGHLLLGPVAVRGAEPGDVLEVRIKDIKVREPFALNVFRPGGGTLPAEFPLARTVVIPLDLAANVARFAGATIPLRPFFGVLGLAPPVMSGRISSGPPGYYAGNLDNKDLVAGTTLYIPVQVPGALLFVGDGHAGQGDGEVDGTAIECSLIGTFELVVRKDLKFKWPRAETPTHFMTMGFSEDLNEAARMATHEMVAMLSERFHLSAEDAYMLASMAADLHVTQNVDRVKGVHAMIQKAIFPSR